MHTEWVIFFPIYISEEVIVEKGKQCKIMMLCGIIVHNNFTISEFGSGLIHNDITLSNCDFSLLHFEGYDLPWRAIDMSQGFSQRKEHS